MVQSIWDFLQYQILGMRWLNDLVGKALTALGLDVSAPVGPGAGGSFGARLGPSLQFFIYDLIKILVLLSVLIFAISYIQSFFPPQKTREILGRYRGVTANLIGALLGTVTPFCSCSSIPLFIGFTSAGLSLGVTFSFLISSPLVDLGSLVLLMSVFGAKVALIYVAVGLILAVIGGTVIEKMRLEGYLEKFVAAATSEDTAAPAMTTRDRLLYAREQMMETVSRVWLYVVAGVGIGALIHNWLPERVIQTVLGHNNLFSVVIATLLGIPMYADIFGTIPIAEALYARGVGLGTILSFMMAVTALSLPSLIMLRKAVKPKLLGTFFAIVTVGIIIIGYVFNGFGHLLT